VKYVAAVVPRRGAQRREIRRRSIESSRCAVMFASATPIGDADRGYSCPQPGTRTLLPEIDVPNPDYALSPGIYCTVERKIPHKTPPPIVPSGDHLQPGGSRRGSGRKRERAHPFRNGSA
jgi:hypothetical protein